MNKATFYFDIISPFSYFAWINLERKKIFDPNELVLKPVLMGSLFAHFGFKGPGQIAVKRNSELRKAFRYAAREEILFRPPLQFPFNPIAINRLCTSACAQVHQKLVIDFLFKKVWQESMVLDDPELLEKIFASEFPGLVEKSFSREAKSELKDNIKQAIASDIFGVPSIEIGTEVFWGNDSLIDVENHLRGDDQWDRAYYEKLLVLNEL